MKKLFTTLGLAIMGFASFGREATFEHEWSSLFYTTHHMDVSTLTSDKDNNILMGVYAQGKIDFDLSSGVSTYDFNQLSSAVVSYGTDKSYRWTRAFLGSLNYIRDIVALPNGEVLVVGKFQKALYAQATSATTLGTATFTGSDTGWNGFVVKLDANGNYVSGASFPSVGTAVTEMMNVEVDENGGIYLTGFTTSTTAFDLDLGPNETLVKSTNENEVSFTVKYDASWKYQWSTTNGAVSVSKSVNRAMAMNKDYVFVAGDYSNGGAMNVQSLGASASLPSHNTKNRGYILVFDKTNGTLVYTQNIVPKDNGDNDAMYVHDIEYSAVDESVVIAGEFQSDLTIDNQIVTANGTYMRGYISKLAIGTAGDKLLHTWTKTLIHNAETQHSIWLRDVAVGPNGDIFIGTTGRSGLKSQFFNNAAGQSIETISSQAGANNDGFSVYFNKNAELITSGFYGNNNNTQVSRTHITSSGKAFMGGWFRDVVDFDFNSSTTNANGGAVNSIGFAQYNIVKATTKIYVNPTKSGNGYSWNDAYGSLVTAMNVAENGDTIFVAGGTQTYSSGITIAKNLTILGGYNGVDDNRDVKANPVIINGNNAAVHVITITASNVTLDGLTIQGAKVGTDAAPNNSGGGIYCRLNNTLTNTINIKNCIIKDNKTFTQGAGFEFYNSGSGTLNLNVENTQISNNTSRYAPAWIVASENSATINFNMTNSLIERNKTVNQNKNTTWTGFQASAGGMMSAFGTSKINANIINCTFANNKNSGTNTTTGNALIAVSEASNGSVNNISLLVQNCILFGNDSKTSFDRWINAAYRVPKSLTIKNTITEDVPSNVMATNFTLANHSKADPLFTNMAGFDYTLQNTSPAINAGSIAGISIVNPDLAGNERIANGIIDLGAYEANSPILNTLSIEEGSVVVYPNPASSNLTIEATDLVSVQITNTNGQVVLTSTENTIDVSNLATGLYILHIQTKNGVYSAKVVKE